MNASRIETEMMVFESGAVVFLGGVTAHEQESIFAFLGIAKARPIKIIIIVVFHRALVGWRGMGQKKLVDAVVILESGNESPMLLRHFGKGAALVGFEGFNASVEKPKGRSGRSLAGFFHHKLMISPQGHEVDFGMELEQTLNHPFGGGTAVDVIPQSYHLVAACRRKFVQEGVERVQAPMDVPKDIGHNRL